MRSVAPQHIALSDRAFGFVFGLIFVGLFGIRWLFAGVVWRWALIAASFFLLLALMKPEFLMPLNRVWGHIAHRLGIITNHIVLGVVFFGAIWPIAMVMRLVGYDPMARKGSREMTSYFAAVGRRADAETYVDQF
jgi:Saxitoxin biosynthesis operon protein SxtJ